MKKNKHPQLGAEFDELQSLVSKIDPDFKDTDLIILNQKIDYLKSESVKAQKKEYLSGFVVITSFLVAVLSGVLALQNNKYKSELEDKLNLSLKEKITNDSVFNKYLGVDSTGTYLTTTEKGKILSYRDLDRSRDSIKEQNIILKDSIARLDQKLNMAKNNFGIYYTETKIGDKYYINVGSKTIEKMDAEGVKAYKKMKPLLDSINKK